MDKVTYSSDTTAAVPGANLSVDRWSLAATGSSTSGYFGGGAPGPRSTMDKVTYSSDTTAAVPGANLSSARQGPGASSARANALTTIPYLSPASFTNPPAPNTGYFGGGDNPTTAQMDKVTFTSDTTAAVPSANLSSGRTQLAATGNSTNGYFGGGNFPAGTTTMDKVTYSSDTTAAVPGANLTVARLFLSATGSSTAGYFGGGRGTSLMDKVTYASDTTAAVPGARLSSNREGTGATSARANGLPQSFSPTTLPNIV